MSKLCPRLTLMDALLLAAAVALVAAAAWRAPSMLSADALYAECLYHDLVEGGGTLAGWVLQPAPGVFPDLLLYCALRRLAGSAAAAYAAYAATFLALLMAAVWLVARQIPGVRRRALSGALAGGVALTGMALWLDMLHGLTLPAFHGGALLLGLAAQALMLRALDRRPRALALAALAALAFVGCFSDPGLLMWFLGPSLLVAALMAWPSRPRLVAVAAPAAALAAGALPALLLKDALESGRLRWFTIGPANLAYGIDHGFSTFMPTLRSLAELARRDWAPLAAAALWLALAFARHRHPAASGRRRRLFAADAALVLACMYCLAGPFVVGNGIDGRYLFPLLALPPFALALWPPRLPAVWRRGAVALLLAAAAATAALQARAAAGGRPQREGAVKARWVEEVARRRGLHAGYSEYWLAKPLMFESGWRLREAAVLGSGSMLSPFQPHAWNCNLEWASGRPGEPLPLYDHAVFADTRMAEVFMAYFGEPEFVERGAGMVLLGYGRPRDILFRHWMRKYLHNPPDHRLMVAPPFGADERVPPVAMLDHAVGKGEGIALRMDPPRAGMEAMELWARAGDSWVALVAGPDGATRTVPFARAHPGLPVFVAPFPPGACASLAVVSRGGPAVFDKLMLYPAPGTRL